MPARPIPRPGPANLKAVDSAWVGVCGVSERASKRGGGEPTKTETDRDRGREADSLSAWGGLGAIKISEEETEPEPATDRHKDRQTDRGRRGG